MSLALYLCVFVVTLSGGTLLWIAARKAGAIGNLESLIEDLGRDDQMGHDLDDLLGGRAVQRPVNGHDASEGRGRVAFVRAHIGLRDVVSDRQAAWVHVLDDRCSGPVEVTDQLECGGSVLDVVEAELVALHLVGAAKATRVRTESVERSTLMLVLAVLQRLREPPCECHLLWEAGLCAAPHIGRDPRVIGCGVRVRLGGEAAAHVLVRAAGMQRA